MAALEAIGTPGPTQRVIVNLSPADISKDGNHYDVPIALVLLAAMKVIDPVDEYRRLANYPWMGDSYQCAECCLLRYMLNLKVCIWFVQLYVGLKQLGVLKRVKLSLQIVYQLYCESL